MNINRVASIDALRGFALLGILLVNMIHLQYATESILILRQLSTFNESIYYAVRILFQGSFLTIFSFLFGYSIMHFYHNRQNKQLPYQFSLIKRGLALIVIGFLHYIFVWSGDILTSYGFMIFMVLLFVNTSEKVLSILASVTLVIYILFNTIIRLSAEGSLTISIEQQNQLIFTTGTYGDVLQNRMLFGMGEVIFSPVVNVILHLFNVTSVPFVLLPFAIFGMLTAKRQLAGKQGFRIISARYWIPIVIVGICLKGGLLLGNFGGMLMLTLGSIATTYGYMQLFLFFYEKVFTSRFKLMFESVGKMTISNYLTQSIIFTLIFSNYGLGLSGKLGLFYGLLLAFIVFALQALCSTYFIAKFKQGPVEYVIRLWIYAGDKKHSRKQSSTISS